MTRLTVGAAALFLAAACSSSTTDPAPRFKGPRAMAKFRGYTTKRPGILHEYLAVAAHRGNELVIVDPEDGNVVLGPGLIFPLSVPILRPARVASARLERRDDPLPGADLLVAMNESSTVVEVVATWDPFTRFAPSLAVDLKDHGEASTSVVAFAAMASPGPVAAPVPPRAWSSAEPVGDRARVLVALSNGDLVVIEYRRDPATGGFQPPTVRVKKPFLQARDIAVSPDGYRLFVATGDALGDAAGTGQVQGVAMVDTSPGIDAAWPVTGLDARGPTRLVAAGGFAERTRGTTRADPYTFLPTEQLFVYAVLDESACGPRASIDCGVATLSPDDTSAWALPGQPGITRDLVTPPELPYRSPIHVPGYPLALSMVMPRRGGEIPVEPPPPGDEPPRSIEVLFAQPNSGRLSTTALLAILSSNGQVYLADAARWDMVNDTLLFLGGGPVGVAAATQAIPGATNLLGIWNDLSMAAAVAGATPTLLTAAPDMASEVEVTPGYLQTDTWTLLWKGPLPSLQTRQGILARDAGGTVTMELGTAAGGAADIADPALGVRVGDLVVVAPDDGSCPSAIGSYTATVTDLRPRSTHPVGQLVLSSAGGGATECGVDLVAPGGSKPVGFTVRAIGLVLVGRTFGYAGRPSISSAPGATTEAFDLRYKNEANLQAAIAAGGGPGVAATRALEEDLAISRKARRKFYPGEAICGHNAVNCGDTVLRQYLFPPDYDPISRGPLLHFRVGLKCVKPATGCEPLSEGGLNLITFSGFVPWAHRPPLSLNVPTAITTVDRSQYPSTGGLTTWVYTAYLDDALMAFSPAYGNTDVATLR